MTGMFSLPRRPGGPPGWHGAGMFWLRCSGPGDMPSRRDGQPAGSPVRTRHPPPPTAAWLPPF